MIVRDRLTVASTGPESKHSGRRWRKASIFGTGIRRALNREERAVVRGKLRWSRALGRISCATLQVGEALLSMLGDTGQLDPSAKTIAGKALVKRAAVFRALAALRDLGLLTWTRRLVRLGKRVEQTSNAYVLHPEAESHRWTEVVRKKLNTGNRQKSAVSTAHAVAGSVLAHLTGRGGEGQRPSDLSDPEGFANRDRQLRVLQEMMAADRRR